MISLSIPTASPFNLRAWIHSGFYTFKINSDLFALDFIFYPLPFLQFVIQCQNITELWLELSASNAGLDTWNSVSQLSDFCPSLLTLPPPHTEGWDHEAKMNKASKGNRSEGGGTGYLFCVRPRTGKPKGRGYTNFGLGIGDVDLD